MYAWWSCLSLPPCPSTSTYTMTISCFNVRKNITRQEKSRRNEQKRNKTRSRNESTRINPRTEHEQNTNRTNPNAQALLNSSLAFASPFAAGSNCCPSCVWVRADCSKTNCSFSPDHVLRSPDALGYCLRLFCIRGLKTTVGHKLPSE